MLDLYMQKVVGIEIFTDDIDFYFFQQTAKDF